MFTKRKSASLSQILRSEFNTSSEKEKENLWHLGYQALDRSKKKKVQRITVVFREQIQISQKYKKRAKLKRKAKSLILPFAEKVIIKFLVINFTENRLSMVFPFKTASTSSLFSACGARRKQLTWQSLINTQVHKNNRNISIFIQLTHGLKI